MKTQVWNIGLHAPLEEQLEEAARLLAENELVAFPTETVYGLGANAKQDEAVSKIYKAKGRPSDNPLIVHVSNQKQLGQFVAEIPEVARKLMDAFWPGPLTFVLKSKEGALSSVATAGLDTVAVRMPDHPVALALIEASGLPIAAPSANLSGKPSPTSAKHVADDLTGRIAGIVDGGATGIGVESTVLDCTEPIPVILRPGGITKEEIEEVAGKVREDAALHHDNAEPKSPGMKYTHYSPEAPFVLVEGTPGFLQSLVDKERKAGKKVGVMATSETSGTYEADVVLTCGQRSDMATVAAKLYEALRQFDENSVDVIFGEVFPRRGLGDAVMNRLMKAAGQQVIKEKKN